MITSTGVERDIKQQKRGGKRAGAGRKKKNVKRVSVRFETPTFDRLERRSSETGGTVSAFIRNCVKKELGDTNDE